MRRATSSIRSISRVKSGREVGITTSTSSFFGNTEITNGAKALTISSPEIASPSIRSTRENLKVIVTGLISFLYSSASSFETLAFANCVNNCIAL